MQLYCTNCVICLYLPSSYAFLQFLPFFILTSICIYCFPNIFHRIFINIYLLACQSVFSTIFFFWPVNFVSPILYKGQPCKLPLLVCSSAFFTHFSLFVPHRNLSFEKSVCKFAFKTYESSIICIAFIVVFQLITRATILTLLARRPRDTQTICHPSAETAIRPIRQAQVFRIPRVSLNILFLT